ncbi:MAG: CBS domain-containing protein [Alphaproteobacteria bacterium]|jgi:CBS domain-containing protein|nr:CBS domain-containing protein [Alphaproteobacteria bacterium]
MTIEVLLPKGPTAHLTMRPDDRVSVAVDYFNEHKRGLIVVVEEAGAGPGKIVGVVSVADIIRALGRLGTATLNTPVRQIMSGDVATCTIHDSLEAAFTIMHDRHVLHVPVLDDDGALRGVLNMWDVLRAQLDQARLDTEQLRNYFLKMGGRY